MGTRVCFLVMSQHFASVLNSRLFIDCNRLNLVCKRK